MEEKRNIKRQIRLRALWLYVAFFVVVAAIIARLVYIQHFSTSTAEYAKAISNRIITTKTLKARRGDILMRDGEPLATVLPLYQVSFDFGAEALDSVERYNKLSDSLAGLLGNYFAKEGYSKAHFKQILRDITTTTVSTGRVVVAISRSSCCRAGSTTRSGARSNNSPF